MYRTAVSNIKTAVYVFQRNRQNFKRRFFKSCRELKLDSGNLLSRLRLFITRFQFRNKWVWLEFSRHSVARKTLSTKIISHAWEITV